MAVLFGALASCAVIAITEPPGPGLGPDAMSYLGSARWLAGHGALRVPFEDWSAPDSTSPLQHFPPGFPLAIAAPVALGAPPVQAARGIEAAAAFVTVAGAVWLVAAAAGTGAGAAAGVVLLASPSLAFDHWQILSEPLFLALLVVTLALMVRGGRPWTYGTSAALAGLVRYAGAGVMGATVLWAFGLRGRRAERLRRAGLAALPSLVLHGAWLVRNRLEAGPLPRGVRPQGGLVPAAHELGASLGAWLAPLVPASRSWAQAAVAGIVALLALAALAAAARRSRVPEPGSPGGPRGRQLLAAAALLAAGYAAVVLWSRAFVFATIPFDQRLLSPFILLAEIATVAAVGMVWRPWRRGARLAAGLGALLWIGASGWATVLAVEDARDGGWGYASDEWRASPAARWLRTEARGAAIFSNDPAAVYAMTGRPSRGLPDSLDADSVAAFGRVLADHHAILVRFSAARGEGVSPDSLAGRLRLREVARLADGVAWAAAVPRPPSRRAR